MRRLIGLSVASLLCACGVLPGNDNPGGDGGVPDAGVRDGGVPDSGAADAGLPDAGPSDAGLLDGGSADAGELDAGAPSSGAPDAGGPDAGEADAGSPDGGQLDAGSPDAGSADAGTGCTAGAAASPLGELSVTWEACPPDITFTVTAQTAGWAAIGFNASPGMVGADIVQGWHDGAAHVVDRHATAYMPPLADAQQDLLSSSASEAVGVTTYSFTRHLVTTDGAGDVELGSSPLYLLWAIHPGDPSALNAFAQHVSRGVLGPFTFAP